MDLNLVWQTVLIFIIGTIFLRIGGRKTISQMTIPQTVIIISIGTLLIQPVAGHGLKNTFMVAGLLILLLLAAEYIQLKIDKAEGTLSGKAVPVIENGTLNESNLKKHRLTVDRLEERLRQVGVTHISDVQYATLETSGQLGYTLKSNKQPATKQDIQDLHDLISNNNTKTPRHSANQSNNIFTETLQENIQGIQNSKGNSDVPKHLQ
ncbi:hypothetical protein CSV61_11735 [Sporosarcina sp. P3]|uniref:DUF421 domain-containing protein n=1 Tax=Sporosarcina sp. P3 TaxID=2048245 RepID=UPI000C169BD0|nr:DUF421 domain-containing protein [Sporosarcina sp. P3]PID20894.1 hypothetical protein CSV61_11735 [Sporosarcina sp. P3]